MELIELQDEDLSKFKNLLQESFQYGYENVYGKCEELILPEKDIDECLKKENPTQSLGFLIRKHIQSKQRHRTKDMERNRNFISKYKNMGNLYAILWQKEYPFLRK